MKMIKRTMSLPFLFVICSLFLIFSCFLFEGIFDDKTETETENPDETQTLPKPTANPVSGSSVVSGSEISLSCSRASADIYWYIGTAMPPYDMSNIDSMLQRYSSTNKPPISGTAGTQVKLWAVAVKTGYNPSPVLEAVYTISTGTGGQPEGNMWANRYPLEDALLLFGAVANYGAKAISTELPALGSGTNYYVDNTSGNNSNPGTDKTAPWKELQYALNTAAAEDTIHIAEGNYLGPTNRGFLIMTKPMSLIGGYAHGFESRDVLANRTMIQPVGRGDSGNNLISLGDPSGPNAFLPAGNVLIDGIIFDRGFYNEYSTIKGLVPGVETGSHIQDVSRTYRLIGTVTGCKANVTIQNCTFLNSASYGVTGGFYGSTTDPRTIIIRNNVFVSNCYAAVEITGGGSTADTMYEINVEFADNTVLFNWERTNESSIVRDNMGYGYRFRTGINGNVHNCIIGFSIQAGLDRSWQGTTGETKRRTRFYENAFVLNRFADLQGIQSPNNVYLFLEQFEDLETLWPDIKDYHGNIELAGDKLIDKLNAPYVKGWINRSFGSKSSPAPSTALTTKVNAFKASFGID